jgi:hypothetical protein
MRSFSEGWARLRSAPALLLGVYAMTVVLAVPLAITMRGLLQDAPRREPRRPTAPPTA